MSYTIYSVTGRPNFDVIPVAVLKCFPDEKRDYKPFTQCKICLTSSGLALRLIAFEAMPEEKSQMRAVFYEGENSLKADVFADRTYSLQINGQKIKYAPEPHFFDGEDLQGKYWGADIILPNDLFEQFDPGFTFKGITSLKGNIFKICENGKRPHCGSFFPADSGDFSVEKY